MIENHPPPVPDYCMTTTTTPTKRNQPQNASKEKKKTPNFHARICTHISVIRTTLTYLRNESVRTYPISLSISPPPSLHRHFSPIRTVAGRSLLLLLISMLLLSVRSFVHRSVCRYQQKWKMKQKKNICVRPEASIWPGPAHLFKPVWACHSRCVLSHSGIMLDWRPN